MDLQPIVLEGISLLDTIQYTIDHHKAPSTIIVCSTKQVFIDEILEAQRQRYSIANTTFDDEELLIEQPQDPWSIPTLRLLASTRTIKLAFCPEVPHLRAYLAALPARSKHDVPVGGLSLMVLLNPILLHKSTSSFSAQGFNRTFSTAVGTAYSVQSKLVVVECLTVTSRAASATDEDEQPAADRALDGSPWEQELSILNVTTKSFGDGERGWVGRTVELRTVAERWCRFETWTKNA